MSETQDARGLMQGVIPYLSLERAREAIDFYQRAFGGTLLGEATTMPESDKIANASIAINGGVIMLSDAFPDMGAPSAKGGCGFVMQLVVEHGDIWWARAVEAGCTIKAPFERQFWGDRYGALIDPFGVEWAMNEPSKENAAKMDAAMGQEGAQELSITRVIAAPRAAVWRCWVEADLLKQWYCPAPWRVSHAEIDVRPGGASLVVMNGPQGEENALVGQYVDVAPLERLVFTDAFSGDWRPSGKPFMTGFVELSDMPDGGTKMVWGARHWSAADKAQHQAMGFEPGWNAAADQLDALARSL